MELFLSILSDLVAELIVIGLSLTGFGLYIRKKFKKQKERDNEQDKELKKREREQKEKDLEQDRKIEKWRAEFERTLKDINIRNDFFEIERLKAYQQIRKYSQKARDNVKQIQNPELIDTYENWAKSLLEDYDKVLESLHEYALLLEHFGHYEYLHSYKNSLFTFCLLAQSNNPHKNEDLKELREEYNNFSKVYDELVDKLKYPEGTISSLSVSTYNSIKGDKS